MNKIEDIDFDNIDLSDFQEDVDDIRNDIKNIKKNKKLMSVLKKKEQGKEIESEIIYTGIYEVLDEIIKRIKEVELIDSSYVDKYADIFIKVYRELKEGK